MSIKTSEIIHIAKLAKVRLSPEQVNAFTEQLNDIVTYMQQLNELDTSGLPSTFHALENTGLLRKDEVQPGLNIEDVLANAPAHNDRSFIVPKIL